MATLHKRSRSSPPPPLFTSDDFAFLSRLPVLAAAALLAPETVWQRIAYTLERAARWFSTQRLANTLRGLRLGSGLADPDPSRVLANQTEQNIGILRECMIGWSPRIDLVGGQNLDAARQLGNGAVLWVAHFCFNSLVGKMALSRAGYEVFHVSRPEHGFSKSRFGMSLLNPLRVAAELRHLKGRLVIDSENPAAAMLAARHVLRQNGFVSITAGAWVGTLLAKSRLGDCELDLATGAPRLALLAAAPLIPIFVFKGEAAGCYTVIVEEPISHDLPSDRDLAIGRAAEVFLARHARYLPEHAYEWREWEKLKPFQDQRPTMRTD